MRLADRYRLERHVGAGGGGGVYLVRDRLADDAPMVLKRLHHEGASRSAALHAGLAQWLVNEFQILAQLDVPSIARVYDFGLAEPDAEDPGGAFFTREFVDGAPLDTALGPPGAASTARLIEVTAAAAEALRALHRLGVVHGDLKPANLIAPRDGAGVVLIDFGLAHGALGALERVRGGTLAFMPPERRDRLMAGDALPPDPRADLYGLCATLLALFGLEAAAGAAHTPEWATHRPDALALLELARRGAAIEPERRFATADDLLAALDRVAADAPGVQPRATPAPAPARLALRPEGREAELGALLEHVARRLVRREGGAASVLLAGEEGTGRSTLLRELTWRAQLRGAQVLHVQGAPGEGPARRLREGALVLAGAGPAGEDLAAVLRRAAQGTPVLLVADDLDLAEPAVAAQLRSVAYACEPGDALLVVATATEARAVTEFAPGAELTLGPLDETAVAALCAQALGPVEPTVPRAVRARTGGLALAVGELLGALAESGGATAADVERLALPPRARDLAARRASALALPARTAAAAVAALGGAAELSLLSRVPGAGAGLAEARARGALVRGADGRFVLSRATLGDALLEALPPDERAALFTQAAQALADAGAPASALAPAFVRAGDALHARTHAPSAIADLRAAGLPLAAAQLLASLRALDPRGATREALLEEAQLYLDAGAPSDAAATASLVDAEDPAVAQRARLVRGRALLQSGDAAAAAVVLGEGLARATAGDEAGEFHRELALGEFRAGAYADAALRCVRGLAEARAPRVRAALLALRGLATSYLGDQPGALTLLEESLALYTDAGDPREEARVLAYLAIARDRAGDTAEARALFERTLERARAAGDTAAMASARLNLGNLLDRLGDLGAALEHFAAAARLAQRAGRPDTALAARLNTVGDLLKLGSYERAQAELEAVLTAARPLGYREIVAHATGMLGVAQARAGDVDAGLGLIDAARAQFAELGFSEGVADMQLDAAEVLLDRARADDGARAAERVTQARSAARELGALEARARLLEARLTLARGDARGAQGLLAGAIELAEREHQWEVLAGAYGARARAHAAVGAELHARRDREHALEVLEAAASVLPPDLRSAFWSVPSRVALRAPAGESSSGDAPSVPLGAGSVHAPTVIAQDQRLVLLLELSRRVNEEPTLGRVLDAAVHAAVELTGAERGALLLLDDGGALAVRARAGPGRDDGPDEQFSRSIAETVLIDGEPVATHNARGDKRFAEYRSVHELAIAAVAAVPVRVRGRTIGVLYVENRRRRAVWLPADVALIRAFGEQAGVAVDRARLIDELGARTHALEAATREIEALLAERTAQLETARHSLARAEEALKSRFAPAGIIAQSEPMRRVFAIVDRVRDTDVPVVIEGESGAGKELVARSIHHAGARQKGPFVVVHCGAIPEALLESELFGHVKGAFTGAERDRKGLLASAHKGTLLLDEVAEMPLKMQVELLRVLQDRRVRPVGAEHDEAVDLRVLATANRPLRDLVAEGRFREDLYYRLAVVTLKLPPLRARPEDIPLLAAHFLAHFSAEHGVARRRLARDAMARLVSAPWPGNVRQLRHVLESAAVLAEAEVIEAAQLALDEPGRASVPPAVATAPTGSPLAARKIAERQRILDALERSNWNKVRAAVVLGMPRRTLYRRLREYGLLEE